MKYSKILLFMTALLCLAFQACAVSESSNNTSSNNTMGSSGDWISPNMGQVASSTNPNEGLSGMSQPLDQQGPNFPWYGSDVSFFSQGYNETTFSFYSEYYTTSGTPVVGIISTPARFDIAQKTPSRIYFGTGQALPYNQYISSVASRNNELWVQGESDWSQYVVSPTGAWMQMVAYAPVGGQAGFYEIVQTNTNTLDYRTYQFYPGYNTMNFNADQVGRHMLYFVVNNQPSNVVIVDVFAQAQPGSMPPHSA